MHTFYVTELPAEGGTVTLPEEERRHLKVRRMNAGEFVQAVDGQGGFAMGEYVAGDRIRVGKRQEEPGSPVRFVLIQALLPPDRLEYALQKAVELGVHEVIFFISDRSFMGKRRPEKTERWEKIIREACKQSGRARFPGVAVVDSLSEAIEQAECDLLWIADPSGEKPPIRQEADSVGLIVGPEGGLSSEEKLVATARRAFSVWIGPWVLRSETVAPAGLALLQYAYGRSRTHHEMP